MDYVQFTDEEIIKIRSQKDFFALVGKNCEINEKVEKENFLSEKIQLILPVIEPDNIWLILWDIMNVVICLFYFFEIPIEVGSKNI